MFSKISSTPKRSYVCPECGAAGSPTRGAQIIVCGSCGTKASVKEWTQGPGGVSKVGRADLPPPDTKIRRGTEGGGVVWDIPAKGKIGFFLIFGLLWTLMTAVVSGGFLLTFLSGGKTEGNLPNWWLIPFFCVFWVTGLILLYLGVRETWMKHRLSVSAGELILQREMLGRRSEKRMLVSEIRSVEQAVFYQQNYEPVFGIEIKGARGKLRFGSGLGDPDKAWLVADLRETIFGISPPPAARPAGAGPTNFSVELPRADKHLVPIAIVLGITGTGLERGNLSPQRRYGHPSVHQR
jgi:DNA-directed RNA polymerase subunit RPC12/RpoP